MTRFSRLTSLTYTHRIYVEGGEVEELEDQAPVQAWCPQVTQAYHIFNSNKFYESQIKYMVKWSNAMNLKRSEMVYFRIYMPDPDFVYGKVSPALDPVRPSVHFQFKESIQHRFVLLYTLNQRTA